MTEADYSVPICTICGTSMIWIVVKTTSNYGVSTPYGYWKCPNGCLDTPIETIDLRRKSTENIVLDLVGRVVLLETVVKKLEEEIRK